MRLRIVKIFLILLLLFFFNGHLFAEMTTSEIVERYSPSVVEIVALDENGQHLSLGSGFFINSEGDIVTNFHILEGCHSAILKTASGKKGKIVEVTKANAKLDLLVAKTSLKNTPSLPIGDSDVIAAGENIVAIGNPAGLEGSVSKGIISGVREEKNIKLIQITAPISPGSSGGPIFNRSGKVIGVATAYLDYGQNLNFAMPINYIDSLKDKSLKLTSLAKSTKPQSKRKKLQAGDTWTEPNTGMEFVWVPGGCYQMGCGSWTDNCNDDEKPVHEVCVDGFWIGKYEVTIDQYRKFLQATGNTDGVNLGIEYCLINRGGSYFLSGNELAHNTEQPMVEVSRHGARAFAEWLSRKTGKEFRLPTEAEWEYAARSAGKKQKYAGGDDVDSVAWYADNSGDQTHEVGIKSPNDLGIYDMSGNVWEWCSDWYSEDYYSNSPKNNPQGPSSGSYRGVGRGGSWFNDAEYVRSVDRLHRGPSYQNLDMGLRLVRTAD